MSTQNICFLCRNKKNYPRIITDYSFVISIMKNMEQILAEKHKPSHAEPGYTLSLQTV